MGGNLFGVIQPNVPTSSRFMSRPSGLVVHCGRTITGKFNYSALLGMANKAGVGSHALAPQIGAIANCQLARLCSADLAARVSHLLAHIAAEWGSSIWKASSSVFWVLQTAN